MSGEDRRDRPSDEEVRATAEGAPEGAGVPPRRDAPELSPEEAEALRRAEADREAEAAYEAEREAEAERDARGEVAREMEDEAALEGRREAEADAAARAAAEPASRGRDPHEAVEQDYQEYRRSGGFASRILIALVLLLIGAGLALWGLPRIAPSLPGPVAAYLTPLGSSAGEVAERLAALEARLAETEEAAETALGAAEAATERLDGLGPVGERLDALEGATARLDAMEERIAAVDDLAAQIQEVEAALASLREQLATAVEQAGGEGEAELVAALGSDIETLRSELAELREQGAAAMEAQSEVEALSERMAALDSRLRDGAAAAPGGEAVAALGADIDSLRSELEALRAERESAVNAASEVEALRQRIAELDARLQEGDDASEVEALREQIATLDQRLAESGSGAEVESLREQIAALQGELENSRATGEAADLQVSTLLERLERLEAAQAEDTSLRDQALGEARRARLSASLGTAFAQIDRAMTLGRPFEEALAEVTSAAETEPPAALQEAAAEGAPTRETLRTTFTPEAHEAIQAALAGEAEAEGGLFGGVLGRLQARVTGLPQQPIEGDTTPAILSRARAAVMNGDLDAALAELQALPPAARQAMEDWIAQARLRAEADAALAQWRDEIRTML